MKLTAALLMTIAALFSQAGAAEEHDALNDLRPVLQDVAGKMRQDYSDRKQAIADLEHDAAKITAVLESGHLDSKGEAAALFSRAEARSLVNIIRWKNGETVNPTLARQSLADLNKLIAGGVEIPEWGIKISQAQYVAGSVASVQLHEEALAYSYWEKCADLGHAGCMNIMASVRLTGEAGQQADIKKALDYHNRVYATGIQYRCAGAISARNIAEINYFTGVRREDDDEIQWVQKAYGLLDRLQAQTASGSDACDRSGAEIEEFLYRLGRGERNDALLKQAASRLPADAETRRTLIQYLSGNLGDVALQAVAADGKSDFDRCSTYFYAMWYSELTNKPAVAQQYHQRLAGPTKCSIELTYAKKYNFMTASALPAPMQK
jgi:hypothetical protein